MTLRWVRLEAEQNPTIPTPHHFHTRVNRLSPDAFAPALAQAAADYEARHSLEDRALIRTLTPDEQWAVFRAMDAWDELLGPESRPPAKSLLEMLKPIQKAGFRGDNLISRLRKCLETVRDTISHTRIPTTTLAFQTIASRYQGQSDP